MTLSRPLLWKEWAEARWILVLGLLIFLGLPLIGAFEHIIQYHSFEIWTSPWVTLLGGVLSAAVGVGVVIGDVTRNYEFIRSQPIPIGRWLRAKYLIGLLVIELALLIPFVIEWLSPRAMELQGYYLKTLLVTLPFTWAAIYSIAFALACLLRRTAISIIAAIMGVIVIYFLPPILPGLEMLSLSRVADDLNRRKLQEYYSHENILALHTSYFVFIVTMLLLCFVAAQLARIALSRDWRIHSNRKTIAWVIGISGIALPAVASMQLGTNMHVLQTLPLDDRELPNMIVFAGDQPLFVSTVWEDTTDSDHRPIQKPHHFVRRMNVGPEITFGPKIEVAVEPTWGAFLRPNEPKGVWYSLGWGRADGRYDQPSDDSTKWYPILSATRLLESSSETTHIELKQFTSIDWGSAYYVFNASRLMLLTSKMQLDFDISDPVHPKFISSKPFSQKFQWLDTDTSWHFIYPTDLGVPDDQVLAAFARGWIRPDRSNLIISSSHDGFKCFEKGASSPGSATYNLVGRYRMLPVELLIEKYSHDVTVNHDFVASSSKAFSGSRVSLYDVSDPTRPRVIGHYASPSASTAMLGVLPDGRVLVDGQAIPGEVRNVTVLGK